MKAVESLIYLVLLHTATANPQDVQQLQQDEQQQQAVDASIPQTGVAPANLEKNQVGFTDTNRAGFNPFAVVHKNDLTGAKTLVGAMTVLSVFAIMLLASPFGLVAALVFSLIGMFLFPQPPTVDAIYAAIYGRIQNQINTAINNKEVSQMVSQLQTLSENINDQTVSYLAQLGISQNQDTKETLHGMATGTVEIPFVTGDQVDSSMKVIDNLLSAPNNWYNSPSQVNTSTSFVLTDIKDIGANFCLHTNQFNLADHTELVVDANCNLNSLDDKLFGVAPNGQLILRTNQGDKCVAYNGNHDGDDHTRRLAVFDINSNFCTAKRLIKLLEAADGTFSLYDGERMLCASTEKEGFIVTTEGYYSFGIGNKQNPCRNNNFLQFQTRIPVILNTAGAGGITGYSLTPPVSFDEMGVQVFYFSTFANLHLAALKEMYLNGASPEFARVQWETKIADYKAWIEIYVPVFEMYAKFAGINATEQIEDAKNLYASLATATLDQSVPFSIQV